MLKKLSFFLIALICTAGVASYFYIYQDHRDVSTTKAFQSFSAVELLNVFTDINVVNDKEVLDQVIEVTGVITDVLEDSVVLDELIFIELEKHQAVSIGQKITIKGRCLGYDDLLEEVKIDQASIL
jgi:hypothetical protein